MLMRVTWGKIKPGSWDEYEKLWNTYAKRTADTPGLKGRYLARDTETTDAGYSISLWESAEAFETFRKGEPPSKEMMSCFVGQYVTTVCDLRGSTLPV
jgi:heme-degrading monooxygenase HmoA